MTSHHRLVPTTLLAVAGLMAGVLPAGSAQATEPTVTLSVLSGNHVDSIDVPRSRADVTLRSLRAGGAIANIQVGGFRPLDGSALDVAEVPTQDPLRPQQWNLDYLQAERLHAQGLTGDGIVVAVLDTGVDGAHPDLADQLVDGWDAVADEPIPVADSTDVYGHGTHVAGIIAAATGNGLGVAALAPDVRVMPIRVLNDAGEGYDTDVAEAIVWAVEQGADVINLSLGGPRGTAVLQAAVEQAVSANIPVVAAAGNSGADGNAPSWPAMYPDALAVASHTETGERSSFSTTGAQVDLAAPGDGIISTYPDGQYARSSGTSMAAPHVSAALGLLLAAGFTPEESTEALLSTTADAGAQGRDDEFGVGIMNVTAAAAALLDTPTSTVDSVSVSVPGVVYATLPFTASVSVTGTDVAGLPVDLVGTDSSGTPVPLGRGSLDDSGNAEVQIVLTSPIELQAVVGETASDAVSVPVTRYASVRSVKKKRTTAVITMVRSDPAPVRVQVRVKRAWTTVVTVPQGSVNVRVRLTGVKGKKLSARLVAPASNGLLPYTSRPFVLR